MSQRKRHHDSHGNADADLHLQVPTYMVRLETAALVKSREYALERAALIAVLLPGGSVTWRRGEDVTVPVELDALHAAVVRDLPAVLLVTLPIALAVQPVDRSRTAVLQGLSVFFVSTELHLPLFFGLRTHTIHLAELVIHDVVDSNAVVEQARDGQSPSHARTRCLRSWSRTGLGSDRRWDRSRVETQVVRPFLGTAGVRESVSSAAVPACHWFPKQKDVDCFQAYEAPCECLNVLNVMALNYRTEAGEYKA